MLVLVWLGRPWPEPLASGFDARGRPVTWAWTPALLGGALLLWLVWFAFDGLWGVFERRRRVFNPLSLVDEGIVGWLLVRVADEGAGRGLPEATRAAAWAAGALALAAAVALELRRVTAPPPGFERRATEDVTDLVREMSALQAPGRRWSYWAVQSVPRRPLFIALGVAFVLGAAVIPGGPPWARLLLLVGGLLVLAVCSGGLRTVVTPLRLVLRAGHLGLPLLRLSTSEIAEVAVPDFDPLRDFGAGGSGAASSESSPASGRSTSAARGCSSRCDRASAA